MSNDLVNWTRDPSGPVLNHGDADDWDSQRVESPSVVRTDDGYAMLYHGIGNRDGFAIGLATSNDGNLSTWERHPANPVLQAREPYERGGIRGAAFTKRLDADDAQSGAVPELRDGEYLVHYGAADRTVVGAATSPDLVDWERNRGNPLWTNATGQFEAVSDPDVYNVSGIYHAFIRAREDGHWTIIHTVIRNATAAPASGDRRPFWAVVGQFPPVGRADSIPAGGTPATGENQTAVP
jgi:hypothetical protein